jgi:curved DNA-binding protein CbpA
MKTVSPTRGRKDNTKEPPRTLYEILGASSQDTRVELKRRYVVLAKQLHPDATMGTTSSTSTNTTAFPTAPSFSEIAEAYRILSDTKSRRRYDRKLQAQAISLEIQKFASDVTERAVLDFLGVRKPSRRHQDTTIMVDDKRDMLQFREASSNHSMELAIPSSSPSQQQQTDIPVDPPPVVQEKSQELQAQLLATTIQRIRAALWTDDRTISVEDARTLVQHWTTTAANNNNNNNELTVRELWKQLKKYHPAQEQRINGLESLETSLANTHQEVMSLETEYQEREVVLQKARATKVLAWQAEKRARDALRQAREDLRQAQRHVADSTTNVQEAVQSLEILKVTLERKCRERDQRTKKHTRHHDRVQDMLRKKDAMIIQQEQRNQANGLLPELEKKEQELMQEYERIKLEPKP